MLKARDITWIQNHKQILKGISLEIKKGECLGLVGPNGSGKSSLLKILAFLQAPTKGSLTFYGQEFKGNVPLSIRRKIAIVFQEPLLLNTSVYENVALGLKLRHVSKEERSRRVTHWLKVFGIAHLAKQHAHSLSGGEAQRVSLARAFVLEPEIIFLDEPFSALDAPTIEDLSADLKQIITETGTTTLIVSHKFRDIKRLTDRVIVLLNGEIKASGSLEEILTREQSPDVKSFLDQLALS